ncbi:hypothetical protein [Nocardioides sp. WS12]|uniref:hypothetical protein n=1 Tax=Nocardioides sp. WS12 TaxID=2486272 RepID=UPI0015F98A35|nr:hypothetical protein [Nocardioides sp. WS12]
MRALLLGIALAVIGCVVLPVSAYFLDEIETSPGSTGGLIVPVHLALTALIGAGLGTAVLSRDHSTRRRALTGAGLGLLGAVVGLVVMYLLLSGALVVG